MDTAITLDEYSAAEMAVIPSEGQGQGQESTKGVAGWCARHPQIARLLLNVIPATIFCGLISLTVSLAPKGGIPSSPAANTSFEVSFAFSLIWGFVCIALNLPCECGCCTAVAVIFYFVLLIGGIFCIDTRQTFS